MTSETKRPLKVGLAGALGRMGRALAAALEGRADAEIVLAFDQPGTEGQSAGALTLGGAGDIGGCDVVIDFTVPAASAALAEAAAARGGPALVVGATGWTEAEDARLKAAAARVPIVRAGNYSLGLNILVGVVEQVARQLPGVDWDVEVFEAHHRRKVDAPSGTALTMGEVIANALGRNLDDCAVYGREGVTGERDPSTIGFSAIRGGDIVGDHTVLFAGIGERIEITHKSSSRVSYAQGALRAVRFLSSRGAGLFDMQDVLGLR